MSKERLIYGRHPVAELLASRPGEIRRLFIARGKASERLAELASIARTHGVQVETVDRSWFDSRLGAATHQAVAAEVAAFAYTELEDIIARIAASGMPGLVVALDQVQDPHNLGAIARSALALGAHGLVIPKDRACEVTAAVVKASAGATAHLPIARVTNLKRALEQLKAAGLWVVGAAAQAPRPLHELDLTSGTVLVIGSEGSGLRPTVAAACDLLGRVPMPGNLGSLNASIAAAIGLYEATRQRLLRRT